MPPASAALDSHPGAMQPRNCSAKPSGSSACEVVCFKSHEAGTTQGRVVPRYKSKKHLIHTPAVAVVLVHPRLARQLALQKAPPALPGAPNGLHTGMQIHAQWSHQLGQLTCCRLLAQQACIAAGLFTLAAAVRLVSALPGAPAPHPFGPACAERKTREPCLCKGLEFDWCTQVLVRRQRRLDRTLV